MTHFICHVERSELANEVETSRNTACTVICWFLDPSTAPYGSAQDDIYFFSQDDIIGAIAYDYIIGYSLSLRMTYIFFVQDALIFFVQDDKYFYVMLRERKRFETSRNTV